jgi:hypothetical protein
MSFNRSPRDLPLHLSAERSLYPKLFVMSMLTCYTIYSMVCRSGGG